MQRQDIDPKKLFVIVVLATLFIFAYQAYLILLPPQSTQSQGNQTIKEEKAPQEVPQLLLGTTREKTKPTNLVSYKSENFELVFAQEGGRLVGFKDLKYNRELITEEEKKLNLFPLEVFTGDPNIDLALNSEGYEIKVEGNRISLSLKKKTGA